jgi:hypothetical protein
MRGHSTRQILFPISEVLLRLTYLHYHLPPIPPPTYTLLLPLLSCQILEIILMRGHSTRQILFPISEVLLRLTYLHHLLL